MLHSNPNQKLLRRSPNNWARPLFFKTLPLLLTLVIALSPLIQTGSISAHASSQANVAIIDNEFLPKHINVTTGTTVIWTYASNWSSLHTVTSVGNTTQGGSPLLNSGSLSPGHNYSYIFYQPGLYTYQCAYHFTSIYMSNAWVNVTGSPVTPPTSANSPNYTLIGATGTIAALIVTTLALFVRRRRKISVVPTSTQNVKLEQLEQSTSRGNESLTTEHLRHWPILRASVCAGF